MRCIIHVALGCLVLLLGACKKEVEKIVIQDKVYSWAPSGGLYGNQQIILNMTKDANSLYLQHPNLMTTVSPTPALTSASGGRYVYGASTGFSSDVNLRLPMSAAFIATPSLDTLVYLIRPREPLSSLSATRIRLRQLDPLALGIVPNSVINQEAFGAIDRHNYLLFSYYSSNRSSLRFVLSQVELQPFGTGAVLQAKSRTVSIPRTILSTNSTVRWIIAVDDYFLVNCEDEGLFKVREDGSFKRVFGPNYTDTCYKWQGTVYLVESSSSILKSTDDGETWQRYTNTPDAFNASTYHVVSDSLVGVKHGLVNLLYTLRWNGTSYRLRELKSDGLGQGRLTGLEQLGDTVYIGTTGGLYKRPLSQFFESRPKL
ncbi:hypothetical protein [Hymenobacter sp. BT559]|uniref:hypothetical protein n=1 Tax=Hymenobacter sp. BT559 TaxID=2795729 RepID=UPI001A1E6E37|nr:hypothetical protein [Hymenobacter sp. BT559]MBJ6143586.1 hypothetical protein [Hymenobacter sp. BT559]